MKPFSIVSPVSRIAEDNSHIDDSLFHEALSAAYERFAQRSSLPRTL